ncbi:MAG: hypothetical protein N3F66_07220 [Spirochaetes bacterium]|nr:hypothetical protein [Spirochaetota bacterium]
MVSNKFPLLLLIVLLSTCTDTPLQIVSARCGSSVAMNGAIVNTSLTYTFNPCTHCRSWKDICNYIYFQGDTVCFSIQCNQNIEHAVITAYFENPLTHTTYKAERIEKIKNTVYGFSLVGSLMEKIFFDTINARHLFTTMALPFSVHINIALHNKKVHYALSDTIQLQFIK